MRSLYAILAVDRRATAKEIKRAYYAAAHDCHPDKRPNDPEAAQRFRDASLAYTVLGDPASRRRYDLLGPMALGLSPSLSDLSVLGADAERLAQALSSVVGGVMGRWRRKKKAEATIDVHVDVACALRGGTQEVRMDRQIVCAACKGQKTQPTREAQADASGLTRRCLPCRGKGTVMHTAIWQLRIPADSGPNDILRMAQAGPMGQDLMAHLRIDPHPLVRCRGLDLYLDMPLHPSAAVLGGVVTLQMPHKNIRFTVPKGSQTGDRLTLANEGLKGSKHSKRGQLHLTFEFELPQMPRPQHLAVWQALAAIEAQDAQAFPRIREFTQGMQH